MKLDSLADKSVMILGFGVEGSSTYNVLRRVFPDKVLGVADRNEELTDSAVRSDENVRFHLGAEYLSHLDQYDVIIRSPGINKSKHPELDCAAQSGTILTSQTALFFENCPGTIIGVTGTKGKGTTSKLTNGILRSGGLQSTLVGNVGTPPLPFLEGAPASSFFVYELSAQQLEDLRHSPHIAVVLNIVPDHLDYFAGFEKYVEAKANIARFQSAGDYLVYNSMFEAPRRIAASAKSKLIPYSVEGRLNHGCSIEDGNVVWLANGSEPVKVISVDEIAGGIPGEFNLHNVLPAISVAMLLGVNRSAISEGIAGFEPLEHRFELAGEYRGIQFYNASIATVPEFTIEHLKTLGDRVQTMLLGGQDRGSDFADLARHIVSSNVKTLILFPGTGARIGEAVASRAKGEGKNPPALLYLESNHSAEETMREAVRLAFLYTEPGKICLHSPASASFGIFKDYRERGALFKRLIKEM